MKSILLVFALSFASVSFAQNQQLVDSFANEICISITNSNQTNDSTRVFDAFKEHRLPASSNFTQKEKNEFGDNVYFRLQRNCFIFRTILERNAPVNPNWKTVTVKPVSKLTNNECAEFGKYKSYRYLDPSGDTVLLTIDKGFWTDHFKDGSFSKLGVRWLSACEFDIEFIESNNPIRKKFSKAGDKYRYQILEKMKDSYLMSVEIVGQNRYSLFKIYF